MATTNYYTPFVVGQTVTIKRSGDHGLVTKVYPFQGTMRINVRTSLSLPALSYAAHELSAYSVQACDHVIVRDDDGLLWSLEVLDLKDDGSAVLFKRSQGVYDWCPMQNIISVIPFENVRTHVAGER